MILERVEVLNQRLIEHFGIDSDGGGAIWRIVWSEDQFEKRLTEYSDSGMLLIRPEVRLLPKYRQWINNKYVLERLVIVPDLNIPELPTTKKSYEPIYVFEDKNSNALPPKWEAAKFVIDTIYAAQYGPKNHSMKKYNDPEDTTEKALEAKRKRVDEITEALWGNASGFRDGIKSGETVVGFHESDELKQKVN